MIGTALQEMVTAPLLPPEEGRVVNPLFFSSVPPLAGTQIFNKRAVSVISGSEEGSESSGRSKTSPLSSTSSVASGQQRAVRDGHPSLSCTPCPAVEPGKCCTAHSDPATGRLPKRAPRAASLRSTSLPHCGYAGGPLGPTCAVSASLVSAPQSVSLAHSDQLFYSLSGGTLGTDALAHSWPQGLLKYAFPPVSLLAQTLCKVRENEERVLLVTPYSPNRTWFPELMLLATAPPWLVPLRKDLLSQRRGTLWHPRPDLWKLHVWSLDGTRRYWVTYPLRYLTPLLRHVHRLRDVLTP